MLDNTPQPPLYKQTASERSELCRSLRGSIRGAFLAL